MDECKPLAPDAKITAMDRFPKKKAMVELRAAAAKHGTKLLLSLGGNARTNGFPTVAMDKKLRKKLVRTLVHFCDVNGRANQMLLAMSSNAFSSLVY